MEVSDIVTAISALGKTIMNTLKNFSILLSSALFIVTQSSQVQADSYNDRSCDCTEIIGKCSGAITDIRNEKVAAQQTTSILFNVRSDHQQCSKVEYYIDNTPHQSIFFGGLTSESIFGLKKKVQIEYNACHICKMNGNQKKKISDDDIDALMDKAQKEGDQRINQANYNARTAINKSNQVYQDAYSSLGSLTNSIQQSSQAINSRSLVRSNAKLGNGYNSYSGNSKTEAVQKLFTAMVNKSSTGNYNQSPSGSSSNSNYTAPKLSQNIISKVSCSGDYGILNSVLKSYQDPMLVQARNAILSENIEKMLNGAKAMGSKAQALQALEHDRGEYDRAAGEAAQSSSQTWGGGGEDLASLLNQERLPLTLACSTTQSLPYQSICEAVGFKWASLATQFSTEIVKKCW